MKGLASISGESQGATMIYVTRLINIDENDIREDFVRSSGPGGQNVNKVATAVQLRFNVKSSASLPEEVRERLIRIAGNRITEEGDLMIDARRFRTQDRNRQDARDRLVALIRKAAIRPKKRIKTRPTFSSKKRRLETKRRRAGVKRLRQSPSKVQD